MKSSYVLDRNSILSSSKISSFCLYKTRKLPEKHFYTMSLFQYFYTKENKIQLFQ